MYLLRHELNHVFVFFFLNVLLNQSPFCGAIDCPYFGLRVTLPMGFKARVVLQPALKTCLKVKTDNLVTRQFK